MASRPAVPVAGLRCPGPALPLLLLALLGASSGQPVSFQADVNGYSLHPPYFNLAEGTKISATATCGQEEAGGRNPPRPVEDLYCKLVGGPLSGGEPNQTIQGQYCDICSSANSNKAHPITNAIDGTERWWQSPPLSRRLEFNEVNVTLDLGQCHFDASLRSPAENCRDTQVTLVGNSLKQLHLLRLSATVPQSRGKTLFG